MTCLRRHFDHTISAYLELNEKKSKGQRYQLSWTWTEAADIHAGTIEGPKFSSLEEAEAKYNALMVADRKEKLSSIGAFKNHRKGFGKFFKAIKNSIVMEEKDLYPELYADPFKEKTYLFGNILRMNTSMPDLTEAEVTYLTDKICSDYGIVKPNITLDIEKKEGNSCYGYYSVEENKLYLSTLSPLVFFHEIAHVVNAHAVDPSISTHHGEMFNRLQVQLMDKYTEFEGNKLFEAMQGFDLFRPGITYGDIMMPIGMLSDKPLLKPMSQEMG